MEADSDHLLFSSLPLLFYLPCVHNRALVLVQVLGRRPYHVTSVVDAELPSTPAPFASPSTWSSSARHKPPSRAAATTVPFPSSSFASTRTVAVGDAALALVRAGGRKRARTSQGTERIGCAPPPRRPPTRPRRTRAPGELLFFSLLLLRRQNAAAPPVYGRHRRKQHRPLDRRSTAACSLAVHAAVAAGPAQAGSKTASSRSSASEAGPAWCATARSRPVPLFSLKFQKMCL
jgi:hypothetical protein